MSSSLKVRLGWCCDHGGGGGGGGGGYIGRSGQVCVVVLVSP